MQIEHDFRLAEGDKVACYFALLGKHTGEFACIAPKGNEVVIPTVSTFRIEGGKLAEAWESKTTETCCNSCKRSKLFKN